MKFVFVVTRAFGKWKRGDIIRDPASIAEIGKSDNLLRVVRVYNPVSGG